MNKLLTLSILLLLALTSCATVTETWRTIFTSDGPVTEFSCDFATNSCGLVGGTAVTSLKLYNATATSSTFYSPWRTACDECNISFMVNMGNVTADNAKFYYATNNNTLAGERYIIENINFSHLKVMPEPVYNFEIGRLPVSTWFKITIFLNYTSGNSTVYVYHTNGTEYGAISGSKTPEVFTTTQRFLAIYTGTYYDHFWITNLSVVDTLGTGGSSSSGQGYVDINGGINFSLRSPLNNSATSSSSVVLNVTVWNMDASTPGNVSNGTLPQLLYNSSLCTVDPGFTGMTYSANTCSVNWTSGNAFSANYSMETRYPRGTFQLLVNFTYPGGNNNKLHPTTDCNSLAGDNRFNLEAENATHFHIKADRGAYSQTLNYYYNTSLVVNFTTNFTTNVSKVCVGTDCSGWESFTRDAGVEDCWGIETGNPSGLQMPFYNITIKELVTPYNITNGTGPAGNSTLNVSFYNSTGGLLYSINGTANGSSINYTWSNLITGVNIWYVTVRTGNNVLNVTGLSFNKTVTTAVGNRTVTLLTPATSTNVSRNNVFSFSASISCDNNNCGDITAYADPVLEPNSTSYNSKTHLQNYNDIIASSTNNYLTSSRFNTTQLFTGGTCGAGTTCMWVPWFDSSSACTLAGEDEAVGNIKKYGSGACSTSAALDNDTSPMVTDEFSEIGLAISAGNASVAPLFDAWANTVDMLGTVMTTYGDIPVWASCRDGTTVTDVSGQDGASDATDRIVIALYIAGNNSAFSAGNRTRYTNMASKLMNQSLQYETGGAATGYSTDFGTTTYLRYGGGDANNGISGTKEIDMYSGYWQDALSACLAHAKHHSENTTLRAICGNWTQQMLMSNKYVGGTSGTNFRFGFFRMWWNVTSGTIRSGPPGSGSLDDGAFDFSSSTARTSGSDGAGVDLNRQLGMCHTLRAANATGFYNLNAGVWKNLSDWCTALSRNQYWLATSSDAAVCNQWTSASGGSVCEVGKGPWDSIFMVGAMAPSLTWINQSQFPYMMDELMRHYSWSTQRFDNDPCNAGLSYTSVRATKAFLYGMDLDMGIYGEGGSGSEPPAGPTTYNKNGTLISTTVGDSPFYTTTANPLTSAQTSCLSNLTNASACTVTWSVNATGDVGSTWSFWIYTTSSLDSNYVNSSRITLTITGADTQKPSITNRSTVVTNSSSFVNVTTDESSNFTMNYGTTTALGTITFNTTFSANKAFNLTGLLPFQVYYYNITVVDISGNTNTTGPYNWTTLDSANPIVRLLQPANGTVFNTSTITFAWNVTDNVATTLVCSLYTNTTGTWGITSTQNSTAGANSTVTINSITSGSYKWNVFCNDTSGLGAFNSTNRTFSVNLTVASITLCTGVPRLVFLPNSTLYNYTTLRTTQSILANGTTVCTMSINTTGQPGSTLLAGFTNYTNSTYKIEVKVVVNSTNTTTMNLTSTPQNIVVIPINQFVRINVTGYMINATVGSFPIKLTLRVT